MSIQLSSLTSDELRRAARIKEKIEALSKELTSILGAPAPVSATAPKRAKMSAAGRAKVAAAQKSRWAKVKASRDLKKASRENKKKRLKKVPNPASSTYSSIFPRA